MTVESTQQNIPIHNKNCRKCGSKMEFRYHIQNNERYLILQCTVCRHFIKIDDE